MEKKSICIIGAGPSGLYMLKNALDQPNWSCTLFERASDLGGIWRFTPDKGSPTSEDLFPSPVHRDLLMNSPKQTCTLLDYPWPETFPTFPNRQDVFDHLSKYAEEYQLREYIKLNQEIILVEPLDPSDRSGTKWTVDVKCTKTNDTTRYLFDYVVVCTGHEMATRKPRIENLDSFEGQVSYASEFLEPSPFKDKRVVIRCAGPSGLDLVSHLRNVASELVLSAQQSSYIFEIGVPENVKFVSNIKSATTSGFLLQDGTELTNIDCLILCTGYAFDYKFLSPACGLELSEDNTIIRPLYNHVVNAKYPGLSFVGVTCYTPLFYASSIQVKWLIKFLQGSTPSLTETDMHAAINSEPILSSHNIFVAQWDYYKKLAEEAGIGILRYMEKVFVYSVTRHFKDIVNYRKDKYLQVDDENFQIQMYEPNKIHES